MRDVRLAVLELTSQIVTLRTIIYARWHVANYALKH